MTSNDRCEAESRGSSGRAEFEPEAMESLTADILDLAKVRHHR